MTIMLTDRIKAIINRLHFMSCYYTLSIRYYIGNENTNNAIVMFHHVLDEYSQKILDSCQCTTGEFIEFCEYVSKAYRVVGLHDFVQLVNKKEERLLVITFDDVPDTFYTKAYPILKKYNLPFVLYIANSFLDSEGYLSSAQVKQLSTDPLCTIGAHSKSHSFLKYSKDLYDEIVTGKEELERLINRTIKDFAYPYGTPTAINNKVIQFVKQTKSFETAVTTVPVLINRNVQKKCFELPRIHSKLFMSKFKK